MQSSAACPHCRRVLPVPTSAIGSPMKCPHCAGSFAVPGPDQAPVPVATVAPRPLLQGNAKPATAGGGGTPRAGAVPPDIREAAREVLRQLARVKPQVWALLAIGVALLIAVNVRPWVGLVACVGIIAAALLYLLLPPVCERLDSLFRLAPGQRKANGIGAGFTIAAAAGLWVLAVANIMEEDRLRYANQQVAERVATARSAVADGRLDDAERELADALAVGEATETADAKALLGQVKEAQATRALVQARRAAARLLQSAEAAIGENQVVQAIPLLQQYLASPHAAESAKAQALLRDAEAATSDAKALAALEAMTDEQFAAWSRDGSLPQEMRLDNAALAQVRQDTLRRNSQEAAKRREAERQRRETERLAKIEEERQRQEAEREKERQRQEAERQARLEQERREKERLALEEQKRLARLKAGIGVSRASIQEFFEKPELGFKFRKGNPVNGQEQVMGRQGLILIQLIGPAENLVQASIMVANPPGDDEQTRMNVAALVLLFMKCVPDWNDGLDWVKSAIRNARAGEPQETVHGRVRIEVVTDDVGIIVVTVKKRE